jgi:parvulin-like peptidyl-prolyl isomerase
MLSVMNRRGRCSLEQWWWWSSIHLLVLLVATMMAAAEEEDEEEALKRARIAAKPWFMRNIVIGNTKLPFSPTTLAVGFLSIFYVLWFWQGSPGYCVASHILIKDDSDATKERLEAVKRNLGPSAAAFAEYASKHSDCPSKAQGGMLGKFKPGDMTPPFDKVCFDPSKPVQGRFLWTHRC